MIRQQQHKRLPPAAADEKGGRGGPGRPEAGRGIFEERVYYGDAELEGPTLRLGGAEVVGEGWAAHEAARREALWEARPNAPAAEPRGRYAGRTYILGQDAVDSLLGARLGARRGGAEEGAPADPLQRAAARLAAALAAFDLALVSASRRRPSAPWARLGLPAAAPLAVTTGTEADLAWAPRETDPAKLHALASGMASFASNYARARERAALSPPPPLGALPPLPGREVALVDGDGRRRRGPAVNQDVLALEREAVPRAAALEAYRGPVAAALDASAAVLERAARRAAPRPAAPREGDGPAGAESEFERRGR
jgi:hypothetical protein